MGRCRSPFYPHVLMPAYVLDFSAAPWSSEAALVVEKENLKEPAAGGDSGSVKERYSPVSKVESLRR